MEGGIKNKIESLGWGEGQERFNAEGDKHVMVKVPNPHRRPSG